MLSTLPESWVLKKRVIYDYEIIYVQSGSCNINVNGVDNFCKANQVVFLRPGIPHSFQVSKFDCFSQPHIHFDAIYNEKSFITPISFKDISEMTEDERLLISEDFFADINIPTVFYPENTFEFKKNFFDLINLYRNNRNDSLNMKVYMLRLLHLILDQFSDCKSCSQSDQSQWIYTVKEYIDANHMHIISLDDIAAYFSCNKFTLLRSFKEKYGQTVISYYNQKRFDTSSRLLSDTLLSIKEISEMLNYNDEYTFSRFFKNKCGLSPTSYRTRTRDSN